MNVKAITAKAWSVVALAAVLIMRLGAAEPGNSYLVQNLVSDGSIPASHIDPLLINAWGLAASSTSPWWVADNETNVSTLYDAVGAARPLIVQVAGHPTGVVSYSGTGFVITTATGAGPARFIFAAEGGTISAWSSPTVSGTQSSVVVPNASAPAHGAIYKGLAIAPTATDGFLYAADFHNNRVDVFDSTFHPVPGAGFMDPALPQGFAPFGIQMISGKIFVAYAKQDEDAEDEVAGDGLGLVSEFNTNGTFVARVASRDALNAPWGMALAPESFGRFSGDLLVGNFGDGRINAFDPSTFEPKGHLKDTNGKAVVIDGLWGIGFGNNAAAGPVNTLYFAAGPHDEAAGLFGRIDSHEPTKHDHQ